MKIINFLVKLALAFIGLLILIVIVGIIAAIFVPKLQHKVEENREKSKTEEVQQVPLEVIEPEPEPEVVPEVKEEAQPTYKTIKIKVPDYYDSPMDYALRSTCSKSMKVKVSPNTDKCLKTLSEYCYYSTESEYYDITDEFGKDYAEYFKEGKINSKCKLIPDKKKDSELTQKQIVAKMRSIVGYPDDIWAPDYETNRSERCKLQAEFKKYYKMLKDKSDFKGHELLTLDCKAKNCHDYLTEVSQGLIKEDQIPSGVCGGIGD